MEGTPFGRYRLLELLGQGGMGEVWRAYDPVHDRFIAVKVLPANFANDQVFQERFRREARAAAGLDDPHVVPIHDSGEIDGQLFVAMKLIKGRDLQDLLDDGPLPPPRAVGIIEQIASALHAAHEVKLVHRDVKPSNILVAKDDFAYLIDFGIARAAGESGLTSTGATIGTWAYMAPERFKREGVADARADIYALACVLHEALTGQPPFAADAIEKIAVAHMLEPPPRPSELQPRVSAAMDDVIATGMAKDPSERYATTKELAQAARSAVSAVVGEPRPPMPSFPAGATEPQTEEPPTRGDVTERDSYTDGSAIQQAEPAAKAGDTGEPYGKATPPIAVDPAPTEASPVAAATETSPVAATVSSAAAPHPASTGLRLQPRRCSGPLRRCSIPGQANLVQTPKSPHQDRGHSGRRHCRRCYRRGRYRPRYQARQPDSAAAGHGAKGSELHSGPQQRGRVRVCGGRRMHHRRHRACCAGILVVSR